MPTLLKLSESPGRKIYVNWEQIVKIEANSVKSDPDHFGVNLYFVGEVTPIHIKCTLEEFIERYQLKDDFIIKEKS